MNKFEKELGADDNVKHYLRREAKTDELGKLCHGLRMVSDPFVHKLVFPRPAVGERIDIDAIAHQVTRRIKGQEEQVRQVIEFFAARMHRAELISKGADPSDLYDQNSILITGETGCGKTFTTRLVCEEMGIYILYVPLQSVTGSGWRGNSVSDFLIEAALAQEYDESAFIVIFFDEVDKTALRKGSYEDFTFKPNIDLLSVIGSDSNKYTVRPEKDNAASKQLNIDRCAFVFAGAFTGIEEIIEERIGRRAQEINERVRKHNYTNSEEQKKIRTEYIRQELVLDDVAEYGLMDEFVGRIGQLINMNPLSEVSYKEMIDNMRRPVKSLIGADVKIIFDPLLCSVLANKARFGRYGARTLNSVMAPAINKAVRMALAKPDIDAIRFTWDVINDKPDCHTVRKKVQ